MSDKPKKTVVLDADDISELAELIHRRYTHLGLSQGWMEWALCDIFRSWKGVDFFDQEPICGRGD